MVLSDHSVASYLSVSKVGSRVAGYFYLSSVTQSQISVVTKLSIPPERNTPLKPLPLSSSVLYALYTILKNDMVSMTETEIVSIFVNFQYFIPLRKTLEDFGDTQLSTLIWVDNECVVGIVTDTCKHEHSKPMNICFYWIRDRVKQDQFYIYLCR